MFCSRKERLGGGVLAEKSSLVEKIKSCGTDEFSFSFTSITKED